MGLRQLAEADLGVILEDERTGGGWPISVTNPEGEVANLTGAATDIAQMIDPETGQMVSGRMASVALRIASLANAKLGLPEGIADATKKPWIIEFDDINGTSHIYKVTQSNPDRAAGVVTCLLEAYRL